MTIVSPMGQLRPVFADKNGKRLSGGKVFTYEPGTLTPKSTYTDALNLIPNTNPINLDESGEADIYLDGGYRMQVYDRYGVLIQDVDNFRTWASGIPAESIFYGSQDLKQFNTGIEAAIEDRYTKAETYSKSEIDASLTAYVGGHKAYQTLALAQAAQSSLPANTIVEVTNDSTTTNNGTYQWNGTTLTKSACDPLMQAKTYTDQKVVPLVTGVASKNLFNLNASGVAIGYFPSNTTGVLQANSSYNTTDFIPVTAGLPYSISTKHYWCWYDASKTFISGTTNSDTAVTKIAPTGAAYMRASAAVDVWPTLQIEQSIAPTYYQSFTVRNIDSSTLLDGSVQNAKFADKTLKVQKLAFIKLGKNIFNKLSAVQGVFVGNDGSTGSNSTRVASDFIEVLPNTQYMGKGATYGLRFVCFYDQYKQVVAGGVNDSGLATTTFTTPSNVKFVKITIALQDLDSFQLEQGSAITSYEDFAYRFYGEYGEVFIAGAAPLSIKTSNLIDGAVSPIKTNFMQPTKNLFNKNAATIGYFIDPTNGNLNASATYDTSALIPVLPSTQYWGQGASGMRFIAYFTAGGVIIPPGDGSSAMLKTFTTPSNAAFVRVSIYHTDLQSFQLEQGSAQTQYIAYGYNLSLSDGTPVFAGGSVGNTSKWSGKAWATLGDSITEQNQWQGFVVSSLGLLFSNFGIGGTKISGAAGDANAMCQDARINAIPTTVDLVTLMGGTNDWAQNVPLGDITSTDPLTFYGALNTFAQKAFTRWPTKRIAVATTPYGEIVDWTGRAGWTSPAKNSLGLTTNDYAEAIRVFCKRANIPCIDVALMAGYGTYNITEAMGGSTTDHLHPASGSNAAKGIGVAHIAALSQIAPIA